MIYEFPDYEVMLHADAAVAQRIMPGNETVDIVAELVPIGELRTVGEPADSE